MIQCCQSPSIDFKSVEEETIGELRMPLVSISNVNFAEIEQGRGVYVDLAEVDVRA